MATFDQTRKYKVTLENIRFRETCAEARKALPTLLRMKYLMSRKRRPDMSPESNGEMNHEATGTSRKHILVNNRIKK